MVIDMLRIAYASLDRSGEAHAVPAESEDRSLCGGQMFSFAGRPWPLAQVRVPGSGGVWGSGAASALRGPSA